MGTPNTFRRLIKKFSSKSSLRAVNINQSHPTETSSLPAQTHSANQFFPPRNPAEVAKHRHDHVPNHLPKPTDGCDEVRYFLYTIFTARTFNLTKTCSQWILETCWAWKGKGYELLNMDDHALREICPLFPGAAPIDRMLYKIEDFPPPEIRELIGSALLVVMRELKAAIDLRSENIHHKLLVERKRTLPREIPMHITDARPVSVESNSRGQVSSYSSLQDPSTAKTSPSPSTPISTGGQNSVNTDTTFPQSVSENAKPTSQTQTRLGMLPKSRIEEARPRLGAQMLRPGLDVPKQMSMDCYNSISRRSGNLISDLSISQQELGTKSIRAQPQSRLGKQPLASAVPEYSSKTFSDADSNMCRQLHIADQSQIFKRQPNEPQMNPMSGYPARRDPISDLPSRAQREYHMHDVRRQETANYRTYHTSTLYTVEQPQSPAPFSGRSNRPLSTLPVSEQLWLNNDRKFVTRQERPPSRALSAPYENLSCRAYAAKLRSSTSTSAHMLPYPHPGEFQHVAKTEDMYMSHSGRQALHSSLATRCLSPEAPRLRTQAHAQPHSQMVLESAVRPGYIQEQVRSPALARLNDQTGIREGNGAPAAHLHRLEEHRERIEKMVAPGEEVEGVVRGSGGRMTCYQMIEQKAGRDRTRRGGTIGEQLDQKWKR